MSSRLVRLATLVCAATMSSTLGAQRADSDTLIVRTLPLQYLSNTDAAKLVSPYVMPRAAGSVMFAGVFEAGNAIHAITVRATATVMARVDSLLKANDRPPATVTFRLQVIAASDSTVRDATISELDAELHNLFRFNGYRLLSQTTVWANENEWFTTTMRGPGGDQLIVKGQVTAVRREGSKSVQLYVSLTRMKQQADMDDGKVKTQTVEQPLLGTGLTIPMGQTVVVGSAMTGGSTPAIILTVRPEIATKP